MRQGASDAVLLPGRPIISAGPVYDVAPHLMDAEIDVSGQMQWRCKANLYAVRGQIFPLAYVYFGLALGMKAGVLADAFERGLVQPRCRTIPFDQVFADQVLVRPHAADGAAVSVRFFVRAL